MCVCQAATHTHPDCLQFVTRSSAHPMAMGGSSLFVPLLPANCQTHHSVPGAAGRVMHPHRRAWCHSPCRITDVAPACCPLDAPMQRLRPRSPPMLRCNPGQLSLPFSLQIQLGVATDASVCKDRTRSESILLTRCAHEGCDASSTPLSCAWAFVGSQVVHCWTSSGTMAT